MRLNKRLQNKVDKVIHELYKEDDKFNPHVILQELMPLTKPEVLRVVKYIDLDFDYNKEEEIEEDLPDFFRDDEFLKPGELEHQKRIDYDYHPYASWN